MQHFSPIKQRILQVLDIKNITRYQFYQETGMSRGVLDKSSGISEDNIAKFIAYFPEISIDWLITGQGSMIRALEGHTINSIGTNNERVYESQEVPLYEHLQASAGIESIFTNTAALVTVDTIKIPNLPKCDGAIPITGDSMYPLLKSGDIVLYKEGYDIDFILWGEMYLVYIENDGEEYFAVKYLQKSEQKGYIRLVSYNDYHQPKEFPIQYLRKWALVKASIRINTAV